MSTPTPDYLRPTRAEADREAWDMGEHPSQQVSPRPRRRPEPPVDHAPNLLADLVRQVEEKRGEQR